MPGGRAGGDHGHRQGRARSTRRCWPWRSWRDGAPSCASSLRACRAGAGGRRCMREHPASVMARPSLPGRRSACSAAASSAACSPWPRAAWATASTPLAGHGHADRPDRRPGGQRPVRRPGRGPRVRARGGRGHLRVRERAGGGGRGGRGRGRARAPRRVGAPHHAAAAAGEAVSGAAGLPVAPFAAGPHAGRADAGR